MAEKLPSDPLDESFVDGLTGIPTTELRRRREVAEQAETQYSYLRRLVQGRLDIVAADQRRREAGEAPGDVSDLVQQLPTILGDRVHAPGLGRLPQFLTPGALDDTLEQRLDAIVTTDDLSELAHLDDATVGSLQVALDDFEREVSVTRHGLQKVVDELKGELVRRYRSGEASIDDLP